MLNKRLSFSLIHSMYECPAKFRAVMLEEWPQVYQDTEATVYGTLGHELLQSKLTEPITLYQLLEGLQPESKDLISSKVFKKPRASILRLEDVTDKMLRAMYNYQSTQQSYYPGFSCRGGLVEYHLEVFKHAFDVHGFLDYVVEGPDGVPQIWDFKFLSHTENPFTGQRWWEPYRDQARLYSYMYQVIFGKKPRIIYLAYIKKEDQYWIHEYPVANLDKTEEALNKVVRDKLKFLSDDYVPWRCEKPYCDYCRATKQTIEFTNK